MMQRPTCTRLRVRSPLDAQTIFHAVSLGILPMVARRLDTEERRAIHSGCVFVWEERGANAEATGVAISFRVGYECLVLIYSCSLVLNAGQMAYVGVHLESET